MFEGFDELRLDVDGVVIDAVRGGRGPAVLLLHGYPQDRSVWGAVAVRLAERFTVVAADLRGCGRSSIPESGADHRGYSFRSMAADQIGVMQQLGYERFAVVGHDRGARVAHRMALDFGAAVERLAVLDILPTRHVLETVDARLAVRYFHWFYLAQPELPERMIGLDPLYYLHSSLGALGSGLEVHPVEALRSYEIAFLDPARRHAMFEDYRAALGVDLEDDRADAGRLLLMPVLVLWGAHGVVGELSEPVEVWRRYAGQVEGRAVDSGHFLIDERPHDVIEALLQFLTG